MLGGCLSAVKLVNLRAAFDSPLRRRADGSLVTIYLLTSYIIEHILKTVSLPPVDLGLGEVNVAMSGDSELVRIWFCGVEADFARLLGRTFGPQFDLHFGFGVPPPESVRARTSVVLLDLRESAGFLQTGLQLIDHIQQTDFPPAMIPLLSGDDPALRQLLLEKGAYDTVNAPPDVVRLRMLLERAHASVSLRRQADGFSLKGPQHQRLGSLIVASQAMRSVVGLARKIAGCDVTALITGETGTGKELMTRAIHEMSRRSGGPFVAFSCANLPETLIDDELFGHERGAFTGATGPRAGRFEMADKGTLFLDEIGDLPLSSQAKLLRVLQERVLERLGGGMSRAVDIRLVCATHRDLESMVREGRFRQDLFYRLNVMQLHIPPLRERREAIVPLALSFLSRFALQFGKNVQGFSTVALKELEEHHWPGNVRQLENVIQRAVVLADGHTIETRHLPFMPALPGTPGMAGDSYDERVRDFKRRLVRRALDESSGNKTAAARKLRVARGYLHRLIQQLEVPDHKNGSSAAAEDFEDTA
jgi:two-component system NtrC family response regulator